jgi:1-acyl-sn-glycerol-3-phosphate acyltransferase
MEARGTGWRRSFIWGPFSLLWGGFTVALASIAVPIVAIFTGRSRALMVVARAWSDQMLRLCGIRFQRVGWEALPDAIRSGHQPVVFMCNHESHFDPPVAIGWLDIPAVFIAKRELKWVPFLGQVIWFMRFIFINRQNRSKALESIAQAARDIRAGKSVVIFPEGTRSPDGRLGEFKKGGFALAQDARVPIVPMVLKGGFEILPKGGKRVLPGHYCMVIGEPVDTPAFASRDALLAEVRSRIEALLLRAEALRSANP